MRKILSTIALILILSVNLMAVSNTGNKYKTKDSDSTYTKTIQKATKKANNNRLKTSTNKSTEKATKKANNNGLKTSTNKSTEKATKKANNNGLKTSTNKPSKKATKKANNNGLKTSSNKPSEKATKKKATKSSYTYKTKSIGRVKRIKTIVRGRTIIQPFGIVYYVHNFNVRIWTNKREYYDGNRIKVYVKANRNCYIVVYDIDTYGNVNVIYPEYGSGYLRANRTKRIDRLWYVEGPGGYEELVVVASRHPFDAYEYGGYLRMELGRGRGFFRTVPNRYRSVAVSSTNFLINNYYNDYGYVYYDNDYYYDDYYYDSGYNGYYGYGVMIINAPVHWGVYIDGRFYGRGARKVRKMKPGWHNVIVKENGKIKYKERVYVKKDKKYKVNAIKR